MLKNTNEIHSIVWSVCFAVGMAIGGLTTYYFGYDVTFMIDVILYIVASFVLLGLHIPLKPLEHTQSAWEMMKSGFYYLKNHTKLLHLILLHATVAFTSFDTLITLLADVHYKYLIAVPLAIGGINASRALGLAIGPIFVSRYINRTNLHYFFALQGLLILLWSFVEHSFYMSLIGMFFVGLLTTTLWSYTYYMIQEEIESQYLGRVIAYNDMIFMLANILITLFVGYSAKMGMGLNYITMVLGGGFIVGSIYYGWFQKRYS